MPSGHFLTGTKSYLTNPSLQQTQPELSNVFIFKISFIDLFAGQDKEAHISKDCVPYISLTSLKADPSVGEVHRDRGRICRGIYMMKKWKF